MRLSKLDINMLWYASQENGIAFKMSKWFGPFVYLLVQLKQ